MRGVVTTVIMFCLAAVAIGDSKASVGKAKHQLRTSFNQVMDKVKDQVQDMAGEAAQEAVVVEGNAVHEGAATSVASAEASQGQEMVTASVASSKEGQAVAVETEVEDGDCHPKCQWKCEEPICDQVCEPVCEPPKCATRCQELPCSDCQIKCSTPKCEVRCPLSLCVKGDCPPCDTVCDAPECHTECRNPQPVCQSICEDPLCDWECHRPVHCPKPKCALVCEAHSSCTRQVGSSNNTVVASSPSQVLTVVSSSAVSAANMMGTDLNPWEGVTDITLPVAITTKNVIGSPNASYALCYDYCKTTYSSDTGGKQGCVKELCAGYIE